MGLQQIRNKGAAAPPIVGMGALLVGCSREVAGTQIASNMAGAPVAVSCEPNQRAVVRQVAVNGALQSQVQCESAFAPVGMNGTVGAVPVGYTPGAAAYQPVAYQPVAYNGGYVPVAANDNTQYVRTAYPQQVVTRQAAPQRVAYQRAPERIVKPKRSVAKSAVIIGASAGAGAGIGAAVGGKKGAGIGALIGGGGAALWDQITRRK
jgi:hypothetical protein